MRLKHKFLVLSAFAMLLLGFAPQALAASVSGVYYVTHYQSSYDPSTHATHLPFANAGAGTWASVAANGGSPVGGSFDLGRAYDQAIGNNTSDSGEYVFRIEGSGLCKVSPGETSNGGNNPFQVTVTGMYSDGFKHCFAYFSIDFLPKQAGPASSTVTIIDGYTNDVLVQLSVSGVGIDPFTPDKQPQIKGVAAVGSTLTADLSALKNADSDYSFQWQRCDAAGANCAPIDGATASSYVPAAADAGQTLRVSVTTSAAGFSSTGVSTVTSAVAAQAAASGTASATTVTKKTATKKATAKKATAHKKTVKKKAGTAAKVTAHKKTVKKHRKR